MKKVILECVTDSATGNLGWIVKGVRLLNFPMVALEGRVIAHDLLEHVNGLSKIGSIDDELEAIGGVWYVRGEFRCITREYSHYTPEVSLASDVSNLADYYLKGVKFKTPVPKTKSHKCDTNFNSIIELSIGNMEELIEEHNQSRYDFFLEAALHYLRSGYNKAKKRFPDQYMVSETFWLISDMLNPLMKYPEHEGQQIELKYDAKRGLVECQSLEEIY